MGNILSFARARGLVITAALGVLALSPPGVQAATTSLGAHAFAVQPMWINEANGGQGACAVTR